MWPPLLQLSRDDCRGILRRLELESYSALLNVFRAHGALTEPKIKLLSELRDMLHISIDRHRAESRRVCNDEHLSTIAESLAGSNTWQDWAREGRRAYPLLPRAAPLTALNIIADDIARKTAVDNDKLITPKTALEIQAHLKSILEAQQVQRKVDIVREEPFKMPDVPALIKNNLKRNCPEGGGSHNKKKQSEKPMQIPSENELKQMSNEDQQRYRRIQQQRIFYSQTQKHKIKLSSKKVAQLNPNMPKRRRSPSSGARGGGGNRRSKKLLRLQEHNERLKYNKSEEHKDMLRRDGAKPPYNVAENAVIELPGGASTNDELNSVRKRKTPKKPSVRADPYGTPDAGKPSSPALNSYNEVEPHNQNRPNEYRTISVSPSKRQQQQHAVPTESWLPNVERSMELHSLAAAEDMHVLPSEIKSTDSILPAEGQLTPRKCVVPNVSPRKPPQASPTLVVNATKVKPASLPLRFVPHDAQKAVLSNALDSNSSTQHSHVLNTNSPSLAANNNSPASPKSLGIIRNIPESSINNTLITPLSPVAKNTPNAAIAGKVFSSSNLMRSATPNSPRLPAFVSAALNLNACSNANVALTNDKLKDAVAPISTAAGTNVLGTANCSTMSTVKLSPACTKNVMRQVNQMNLKQLTPATLRGNVKICQSSNGKIFIQPASMTDGGKIQLQTTQIHKLDGIMNATGGTRLAIKKLQMITSSASGSIPNVNQAKPTTFTLSGANNKGSMIIMPNATAGLRTINIGGKMSTIVYNAVPKSSVTIIGQNVMAKPKDTIAVASPKLQTLPKTAVLMPTSQRPPNVVQHDNAGADSVMPPEKRPKVTSLSATDWELELDQQSSTRNISNKGEDLVGKMENAITSNKADDGSSKATELARQKKNVDHVTDTDFRSIDMEIEDMTTIEVNTHVSTLLTTDKMDGTAEAAPLAKVENAVQQEAGAN